MAIIKNQSKEKYTVVINDVAQSQQLSLKARGLLVYMLSLPNNWNFNENALEQAFPKDGQTSVRSGLKELEEFGYLKRTRTRNEFGVITGVDWTVCEIPHFENHSLDNPNLETTPLQSTNIQSNKKQSNNQYKDTAVSLLPEAEATDQKQAVFELLLNDKSLFPIYDVDVEKYKSLFPNANVEQCFRSMIAWIDAHPTKRKTKRGIKAFINSWISREQDKYKPDVWASGSQGKRDIGWEKGLQMGTEWEK